MGVQRGSSYPIELRDRVIQAWRSGRYRWEELAELFGVGLATVNRWIGRYRRTGSAAALPHGGGQPLQTQDAVVERIVVASPDLTRDEIAEAYAKEAGKRLSVASIGRALRRLGFTRKKSRWYQRSATDRPFSRRAPRSSSRSGKSRRAGSSTSTKRARTSR